MVNPMVNEPYIDEEPYDEIGNPSCERCIDYGWVIIDDPHVPPQWAVCGDCGNPQKLDKPTL